MSNPTALGYPSNGYTYPHAFPYRPQQQAPRPRAAYSGSLIGGVALVIIVLSLALLIFYLATFPRLPTFHVTALSLSNFSASDSTISGNWDCRFQVRNPSTKMAVFYRDVVSKLYYKSQLLSVTSVAPFDEDKRNVTAIDAKFSALGSYIDGRSVESIKEERRRSGLLRFSIYLECLFGYRYGSFWTRRRFLRVWCDDVAVNVTGGGSGNSVGGATKCVRY